AGRHERAPRGARRVQLEHRRPGVVFDHGLERISGHSAAGAAALHRSRGEPGQRSGFPHSYRAARDSSSRGLFTVLIAHPSATRRHMKILADFKAFAMKGNVVDMAVGVVIGAGFGKIVSSLVADIITPVLGLLIGGLDFKDMKVTLREARGDTSPAVTWNYGTFLQSIFDFLIIAIAIFSLIKLLTALQRK